MNMAHGLTENLRPPRQKYLPSPLIDWQCADKQRSTALNTSCVERARASYAYIVNHEATKRNDRTEPPNRRLQARRQLPSVGMWSARGSSVLYM